ADCSCSPCGWAGKARRPLRRTSPSTDVRKRRPSRTPLTTAPGRGRLDVAVNNAGVLGAPGPLDRLSEDEWSSVLATNLTGVWTCMKYELALMREGKGGAIVNMAANIGAHMTIPYLSAYTASKAAVSALTRVAALECIADGIRVNAVSPGLVDTDMSLFPGEGRARRDARVKGAIPA